METCLERRFHDQVDRRRHLDAEREELKMALSLDPDNEELEKRLQEIGTETTNDYVLKAMRFVLQYEEIRKSSTRPVSDFRTQRSKNPALNSNKRRQRDFERHNASITEYISVESGRRLRAVYEEYMQVVEGRPSSSSSSGTSRAEMCSSCQQQMVINARENYLVCLSCGVTVDDTTGILPRMSGMQSDSTTFHTRFPYLRVNHFQEALMQIQGKESSVVPQEVVDIVSRDVMRMRVPKERIRPSIVRDLLKRHKYSQYYENCPQICKRIGGFIPPNFTPEFEERCRLMFWSAQEPFEKHRPSRRTNWISYNYTLMKICELLGVNQDILDTFPVIKSRDKLFEHDRIWRAICADLNWPFHRTI